MPFTKSTAEITAEFTPYFSFRVGMEGFLPPPQGQIKFPGRFPAFSLATLTGFDCKIFLDSSIKSLSSLADFSASDDLAFGETSATAFPMASWGGIHWICSESLKLRRIKKCR